MAVPGLPLMQPMTQREQFERSFTQEAVMARLALSFGLLAALLVAAGIYGAVSYGAARRTAEVGIRLALGARRVQVVWMVLRGNPLVCAIGAAAGIPLAIWGGRLLRSTLFGIASGDPRVFVLAIGALLAMAAAASAIPARRAASVDPMTALRQE